MIPRARTNGEPLLVGRQDELAQLRRLLEAATDGRLHIALIAGAPGIGKTRLLDEFAAAARSALVLRGAASEAAGMPPYLPFLEAVGSYIRTAGPDVLGAQTGPLAGVLATIFPELSTRLGELPPMYPLPAEQAQLRLYEAVGAFLSAMAASQPVLLILDDLQWADPASLDLLCYVSRQCSRPAVLPGTSIADAHRPRLLILGACRDGDGAQNLPFQRAVAELNRLRLLSTVLLQPLAAADVARLATHYLGDPVDRAAGQLLYAQSEGNPFLAEELLRAWRDTGVLTRTDALWSVAPSTDPLLPRSIRAAVHVRLARLAPEVVELLRTAAIIGRTFDVALLAEAVGQDAEEVEAWLRRAVQAEVLVPHAGSSLSFSHDTIRETLYADVAPLRRRRLHGYIGRGLEAHPAPVPAQRLAALAFHFGRSGDRARGAAHAWRAAEHAMSTYAPDEALAHYRAALELSEGLSDDAAPGGYPRRGELLLNLGAAAVLAGDEPQAAAAFTEAREWFQQAGELSGAARAAERLGQAWWRQEDIPAAEASYTAALALLGDGVSAERVRVLIDLGTLLAVSLHRQREGLAHARLALDLARALADDVLIAAAYRTVGNLLVRSNDLAAGITMLEQALAVATAVDDPLEAAECCACLVLAYAWNADLTRSRATLARQLAFAARCHDPYQVRHIFSMDANLAIAEGRFAEGAELIARAQVAVERLNSLEPVAFVEWTHGYLAYQQGDYAAAEQQFATAMERLRRVSPLAQVWYLGHLAIAQLAQGKRQAALSCMVEVEELLAAIPAGSMPSAEPLAQLTTLALALGDRARIERYYPLLVCFRGQFHDVLVDRLLGQVETLKGEWAAAQAHLEACAATARREHLHTELALTWEAQAELLLAQDGPERREQAHALLVQARDLAAQLGMAGTGRRLEARLSSLPRQSAARAPAALPDGLTSREAEVLILIAAGLSNREIAARLVLSVRTVESHITHIYAKIGARGKADATAYTFRHGLA